MNAPKVVGADWLTVSQAAALLGVSERTVQRRAAAGELLARKATDADGIKWEVCLGAAKGADTPANSADTVLSAESAQTPQNGGTVPPSAANGADTREADLMAALLAEKDGRIDDLQKQLDAANGALEREQMAHAETRRVLAFNMATPTLAPTASNPTSAPMPAAPTRQPQRPQSRRPRPFWAALIGYRPKD
jgi:hypothetical protein